jgi:glycine betaine/proline transport system substrate-binding protein
LAKAALEANDFEVTITNLAPGMIFVNSKDDSKGDVFLMPASEFAQRLWADYGENLVVIGEAFSDATTVWLFLLKRRTKNAQRHRQLS